jgi:hypothetical protein
MIILILILAAAKYIYQALVLAPFEIDQEFLALEAWKFLKEANPTLVGAHTSTGNIYIGPGYTYLVTAIMWATRLNPWIINALSALWAILTIVSLYFIGGKLFSRAVGIIAALLAATSINYLNLTQVPPLVIPLSLVSLLTFYCLAQLPHRPRLFLPAIILAGIGLQLHFTGLYLLVFIVVWIFAMKIKITPVDWLKAAAIVLIFLSPLILFDLRHNFLNSRNFVVFLLTTNGIKVILAGFWRSASLGVSSLGALVNNWQGYNLVVGSLIILSLLVQRHKLLVAWVIFPIILNGLYTGGLLPYYYMLHQAQVFLVAGLLLARLAKNEWGMTVLLTLWLLYSFLNWRWHWQQGRGFNLTNKLAAFELVKTHAGTTNVNLSLTVDHTRRGGLDFLRRYYGFDEGLLPNRPTYTLISPHGWQRLKANTSFGEIDVILPPAPR